MNPRRIAYAASAGAFAVIVVALAWQRSGMVEARRLEGSELLGNLRGYLEVDRLDEATEVLTLLIDPDCLDQARYEVACSYVAKGGGEKAIALLDKISLHDRSFDFQRAVLREKIRAVFSFFFDPTGDLRAPAQIADYVYHSEFNPDPALRPRNPAGHEDPNALLDYFDRVASQIEDVMRIQGLERADEPALAESYDAIQVLLYGRGVIGHAELASRLASSPSGESARTLYLLGNQHFTEADCLRAFECWGDLVRAHHASDEAARAFSKVYELFEARARLTDAFAFWPIEKPAWLARLAGEERFAKAAEVVRARLDAHKDLARYKGVTRGALAEEPVPMERELFVTEHAIDTSEDIMLGNATFELGEADTDEAFVLERDHSLGWRLQTEFREFLIKRSDDCVFTPSAKKSFVVRTSYHGEVIFEARRFASGDAYNEFSSLDSRKAVLAAAALPVAKTWTEDLVVPGAGPWTPVTMPHYPKPTRPALKEFIASPRRRARVLVAAAEKRIDDARALLVEAAEDADFEETTIACDAWRSSDGWADGPTWVLAFRPDRTGDFLAPAAYVDAAPGMPVASAPPFGFRVIDSGEDVPRREAELRADASMRRAVADALALAPDGFLENALARVTACLDLRSLAIMGVLMSDDPCAPDAYAALAWGRDGASPRVLGELVGWRKAMLDDEGGWVGGDVAPASPAVLARALGSAELASRTAVLELIALDDPERDILNTENAWRRALCVEARKWRTLDDVPLRPVTLGSAQQ